MITDRFLLPAGFLPTVAPYSVFKYYEELRSGRYSQTPPIASGFEYDFMVDQAPDLVNRSPIGGKIVGVHGPWTQMIHSKKIIWYLVARIFAKPTVGTTLLESALKTISFAKAVRAKYIVLHTIDLDFDRPEEFLAEVVPNAKSSRIQLLLEPDLKTDDTPKWVYNHAELYGKFKIPVVFDPATVEVNGESLIREWERLLKLNKNVNEVVKLVHLNEYQPHLSMDQGVLKSDRYANLLREIKKSGYKGYFNFEVSPLQGQSDKIIAMIYATASFLGLTRILPITSRWYSRKASKNLYESVVFAQKHLE